MEEGYPNRPMGEDGGLQDRSISEMEGIWGNMGFVYLLFHFLARAYQTYILDTAKKLADYVHTYI